jgi:4-hydroxythreonine-4-phosphate dehydrogenase
MKIKPILIIAGEPYGVFSEIFFKTLKKKIIKTPIILIASKELISRQMKKLGYNFNFKLIDKNLNQFRYIDNRMINIINVDFKFKKTFDKISDKSNNYIQECFKIALKVIQNNEYSGLINGPISKKNLLKDKFLGITEYLAVKTNKENKIAMLIYNKKLSVSPITTHLPLKDVHKNISKQKIINQINLIVNFYKKNFKKNPKIAITGLNPHCESNYKSSEEKKIIEPAIKYLLKKKNKVYGPFAADTIFMKEQSKNYDVVVGMYHDQVLSPLKSLFGFNAINITLGLPFIRISPDHGPNYSMLGKNISDPKSLIEALKFLDK